MHNKQLMQGAGYDRASWYEKKAKRDKKHGAKDPEDNAQGSFKQDILRIIGGNERDRGEMCENSEIELKKRCEYTG